MEISVTRIFWRSVSQVFLSYPKPKANVFNDYFASQAMIPNNALLKFHFSLGGGQTLFLLSQRTGEQKVRHPVYSADISKPSGCDRVSNKIIRLCSAGLYEPFTSLICIQYFISAWSKTKCLEARKCFAFISKKR